MMYLLKPPGTTNEQTEADAKSHPLHSDNIPLEIALNVVLFVLEQAAAAEEHRLSRDTLDRYVTDWRAAQEKLNPRVQATKLKAGIESLHEQWRLARLEWLEELGLDKASFYSPLLSLLPLRSSSPANTVAAGRCIADYLAGVVDSDEEFTKSMALIDRNLLEFWSPELRTLFCNTSGLLMKHAKRWMNTRLNVELIRRDMERRSVLLQALVTGKSEWAAKHNKQLQEMLKSNDDSEVVAPSNELMILPQLSVVRYDSEKRTKIAVYFRAGSAGNDLPRVTKFLKLKSDRDGTLWTQPPLSLEDSFLENLEGLSIQRVRVVLVGRYEYIADKPLPQPPPTAAGVDLTSIGLSGLERGNRREFNCIYSRDGSRTSPGFCPVADFRKMHGGEAYYAPLGWHRWAVDMGVSGEEFNRKYAKWPVAFHGTKQTVIGAILERGLRMSMSGCFLDQLGWDGCVYVSPSLVYCSHPRYAQPLEQGGQWVQVRVNPKLFRVKRPGTLHGALESDPKRCDKNYSNSELEWLVRDTPNLLYLRHTRKRDGNAGEDIHLDRSEALAIYGILFRIERSHPYYLPENSWWNWKEDPELKHVPLPPPPAPLPLPPQQQPEAPVVRRTPPPPSVFCSIL